ncbi:MAG TPA: hypothetical protein IAC20_00350 [Candidatus Faecisoma merdavium]|nr:hypothetical protein [Candidatus Faecisoma merdavium]
MSKNLVTPILLERNNKKYILMNFVFESDNSIYITFPSKKGRYISKEYIKEYEQKEYSEHVISLQEYRKDNIEPKISFHPRNMIVHVNSNVSKNISNDYELLDVSPIKGKVFVYLLQVIFPNNINFYDDYNKTKHPDQIVIQHTPDNDSLSLEFIIHSNDIYPTFESLPFSKNRNYRFGYRFDSPYKYSYSIFVSTLSTETKSILINLNTKNMVCMYTIDNK